MFGNVRIYSEHTLNPKPVESFKEESELVSPASVAAGELENIYDDTQQLQCDAVIQFIIMVLGFRV